MRKKGYKMECKRDFKKMDIKDIDIFILKLSRTKNFYFKSIRNYN